MRIILIISALFMMGCQSTPYRDDYAKHTNQLRGNYIQPDQYQFKFAAGKEIDLRGAYSSNTDTAATPVMYHGGAGLVGLALQVGIHSAMVQSGREGQLSEQQQQANESISAAINASKSFSLTDIAGDHASDIAEGDFTPESVIHVKPIFFGQTDHSKLSLKTLVWIEWPEKLRKKKKKLKHAYLYSNLIHVHSNLLSEEQRQQFQSGDSDALKQQLQSMLQTSLDIAKAELTGQYKDIKGASKTFFLKESDNKKVIRGVLVEETCNHQVVKNLHQWFVVLPKGQTSTVGNECALAHSQVGSDA
ncbi:hypothetical protein FE810_11020 [Thalassotalea litorea]|uniref:Lipoprotein n=1 Tax=Thalassotalea litorea TaxID=2020715 RepID=A0A5R9IGG7_9GAMM|nr:hypothetical protein [Thalassotalea litorea]TLU64615.1 hypothetical protein FE810_11020 [Thalassotalea litorea]